MEFPSVSAVALVEEEDSSIGIVATVQGIREGGMKTCPNPDCPDIRLYGAPGEFLDRVERCPKCKAVLELKEAGRELRTPFVDTRQAYGFVAEVSNPALIPVAKSLLDSAGIRWLTRNEFTQNLIGGGQLGTGFNVAIGGVEFWVEIDAVEEVLEILSRLEREEDELSGTVQ